MVRSKKKARPKITMFFSLDLLKKSLCVCLFVCPRKQKQRGKKFHQKLEKKRGKNNSVCRLFTRGGGLLRNRLPLSRITTTARQRETETERQRVFVVVVAKKKKKKKTTTGFERERSDAREKTKRTAILSVWGNALIIMNSGDIKTRLRKEYETPSTCTTHLALTLVQLIFALMHTLANPSLKHIPSFAFCTLRLAIALPFLYFFGQMEKPTQTKDISWKQRFWFVPMGTFLGIAYLLVFVCNERSGAIAVASVQPLMPVCTAMLSFAFGLERMCFLKAFFYLCS